MKMIESLFVGLAFLGIAAPAIAAESGGSPPAEQVRSGDAAGRLKAIQALGQHGPRTAGTVDLLVAQLKDQSPQVRAQAADALGRLGEVAKPAAPALAALLADPDKTVRREALNSLLQIGPEPGTLRPLIIKALDEADPAVRMAVLHQLAELGKQIVPGLIEALKTDGGGFYACLVLAAIGPEAAEAVPALADKVRSEDRPDVRREAILALGAIGKASAPAVPSLIKALDDKETAVSMSAAFAIGQIGPGASQSVERLSAMLKSKDEFMRIISAWALAKIQPGDEQALDRSVPLLAAGLRSNTPQVRAAAFRALGDLRPGPTRILAALEEGLKGADQDTIHEAVRLLATVGAPAVPKLIEALGHAKHRSFVAQVLAAIGPPAKEAVPALVEVAKNDNHADVRSEALMAIANIGPGPEAVPAAVAALGDRHDKVVHAACYVLGMLGPKAKDALPELANKLSAVDPMTRLVAAWAIARIGPSSSDLAAKIVPILVTGLKEQHPKIREGAAKALGVLGARAKGAASALQDAAKDEDPGVQKAAQEALKAIGA